MGMFSIILLTLGAHAPEGYGSCPVCVSVCLSETLTGVLNWRYDAIHGARECQRASIFFPAPL